MNTKEKLEKLNPSWCEFILEINRFKLESDEFKPLFFYYAVALFEEYEEFYNLEDSDDEIDEFGDVVVFSYLLFWLADKHKIPYVIESNNALTLGQCLRFYRGDNDTKYVSFILTAARHFIVRMVDLYGEEFLSSAIEHNLEKLKRRVKIHGSVMKDK